MYQVIYNINSVLIFVLKYTAVLYNHASATVVKKFELTVFTVNNKYYNNLSVGNIKPNCPLLLSVRCVFLLFDWGIGEAMYLLFLRQPGSLK